MEKNFLMLPIWKLLKTILWIYRKRSSHTTPFPPIKNLKSVYYTKGLQCKKAESQIKMEFCLLSCYELHCFTSL